jgi:hypothetical protein
MVYSLAGWMTKEESKELRKNVSDFELTEEGDWQ